MLKRKMRRVLAAVMIITLLCGMFTVPTAVSADLYIGDINMDGVCTSTDVRMLLRCHVLGVPLTAEQQLVADMDGNGVCDTTDARAILLSITDVKLPLIPLSGFEDRTDSSGNCRYTMRAEFSDTYTFTCSNAAKITVATERGVSTGTTKVEVQILADEVCDITVLTRYGNTKFNLQATPKENNRRLPYEPRITVDPDAQDVYGNPSVDPLEATVLEYTKREGGSYIYLNNPEKLQKEDIGQAIMRNSGLTGDVEVTWEHSNFTGRSIYLGYQLKNEGTTDVFVTVTNIGYQTSGEWLGQQSWSDYYNYQFTLPSDYFDANGNESERYKGQDFIKYSPRVFQPTTYRIPAGKYIYVLGGTTTDAYNNTNVASTADKKVAAGKCTNAVAKFHVYGGDVTGTFYCYDDVKQVMANPAEQGYVVYRNDTNFGHQYKGIDYHQGLIEADMQWTVNDKTPSQQLPVTYTLYRDSSAKYNTTPYAQFNSKPQSYYGRTWTTNINPQNDSRGIGSDMMSFECVTTDGKTVVIDNDHADGTGDRANLGNWMVDYQEDMTFVNQGNTTRYFTINKNGQGALMAMVLDADGEVLTAKCTICPITASVTALNYELYTVEVPPHSVKQVTVNYLLMGNSYGCVGNWVQLR